MKKVFWILIAVISLTACSNQQKAEKGVKAYLNDNLKNNKSYDPVEFSELKLKTIDDLDGSEELSEMILTYKMELESFDQRLKMKNDSSEIKILKIRKIDAKNKLKLYTDKYNGLIKKYAGKDLGYIIKHKYRASNSFNAIVLEEKIFYLNSSFVVIDSK